MLTLHTKTLADGAVEFFRQPCPASLRHERLLPVGRVGDFTISHDPDTEGPGLYEETFIHVLVVEHPKRESACFRFAARPLGTFVDQRALISVTIEDGERTTDGEIEIVLRNTDRAPHYLAAAVSKAPASVRLAGVSQIWLHLKNELPDVPLEIGREIRVLGPESLFRNTRVEIHIDSHLGAGANVQRALEIEVTPVPHRAIGQSCLPPGSEEDEALTLLVPYRTRGGIDRTLVVPVTVRFKPSIWSLIFIVMFGGVIGSMVPPLVWKRRRKAALWFKAALVAALLAFIVEIAGISLQTELKVRGHTLDPYQLLPAFLIGLFVGAFGFKGLEGLQLILPASHSQSNSEPSS